MKRIVSLILALSMVLSMFTFSFAGETRELKDVNGTKYEAAVEALMELKVVEGYPDDTYLPDNVVTRAELAKLLVVAYGLKPAAEAAGAVTPFPDANNHWASGYVNVSADYKFVNGYTDGSFQPDGTVTYAEAITMCLRVLGYANEIDAKGTWPTNYIAKAQDLKLMKDIEFDSYNEGAKRGNVALLIWNMLRTEMWEVTGESEGDGLQSKPNREMLNVKFSDYKYEKEVEFKSFKVGYDSKEQETKVYVSVDGYTDYEYSKNDFYTFVPGTEVEVLVNTENKEVLTIVPNGEDKLDQGTKAEIDDEYASLSGEAYDYAYAIVEDGDAEKNVALSASSIFVDKVEVNNKKVVLTHGTQEVEYTDSQAKNMLVLKDGERVALLEKNAKGEFVTAVEKGDIFTTVTGASDNFYVIGGSEVEGELTKHEPDAEYDDGSLYATITVDGEQYLVDDSTYFVVNPEKTTITEVKLTASSADSKMKGEVVTLKLDPVFGKVVRIEFDGKIDAGDEENSTWEIFAIDSYVSTSNGNYTISLSNADGSDEYDFANVDLGRELFIGDKKLAGYLVAVELDDEKDIEDIQFIAKSGATPVVEDTDPVTYGDVEENEIYEFIHKTSGLVYDEKEDGIMEGQTKLAHITDDVVVIRLVYDDNDTTKTSDDTYTVEFASGIKEVEDVVTTDEVIVVLDKADKLGSAKYVVLFEKSVDTSDLLFAKVTSVHTNTIGELMIKLNDTEEYEVKSGITKADLENYQAVAYKIEENSDGDKVFVLVDGIKDYDLKEANDAKHAYVSFVDGTGAFANISGETADTTFAAIKVGGEKMTDLLETTLGKDFKVLVVNVGKDSSVEDYVQYKVSSLVEVEYSELSLLEDDRLSFGNGILCVIRGMDPRTDK